jgi:chromate transporter
MRDDDAGSTAEPAAKPGYSLGQLARYALRLGALGFGGPVALVGYMHRDLVERRGWIDEADFKEGLTLAQLMPGPLAAQLAIYLGYVHYGLSGATVVGVIFVLPSFAIVVALGWAYVAFGGLAWMQAVFYGVGACVIAIIALSAIELTRSAIGRNKLLGAIYLVSAATTIATESEMLSIILAAGLVHWIVWRSRQDPGDSATPVAAVGPLLSMLSVTGAGGNSTLVQIALYFTKAGAFVFGSGLAIVPFLYGGVVNEYGWLNEQQFLDAVAVAMITPGPVVISVGFIGYLVAGFSGAVVASVATFLPCYFFTVVPAPYFKRHGKRPGIVAFVEGVTAATIGAIGGAVIVLGRRTLLDESLHPQWPKIAILMVSLALLARFRKLPEPVLVLAAAMVGLVIYPWVG